MEVQTGVAGAYTLILLISEGNKVTETGFFVCLLFFGFGITSVFVLERCKAWKIHCRHREDLCAYLHLLNFFYTLVNLNFTSSFLSLTILVLSWTGWPSIHTSPLYTDVFKSMEFPLIWALGLGKYAWAQHADILPKAILLISTLLKTKYLVRVFLCGLHGFLLASHTVCSLTQVRLSHTGTHTWPGGYVISTYKLCTPSKSVPKNEGTKYEVEMGDKGNKKYYFSSPVLSTA